MWQRFLVEPVNCTFTELLRILAAAMFGIWNHTRHYWIQVALIVTFRTALMEELDRSGHAFALICHT